MNITLCLNEKYLAGAIALLKSILVHCRMIPQVYVLHDSLSPAARCRLRNIYGDNQLIFQRINIATGIRGIRYFDPISCGRIYIPEYVMADSTLYLDSDVLCLNDILELYITDLKGYALGAVVDPRYQRICQHMGTMPPDFIPRELRDKPAFNSGVLLMDLESWRQMDLTRTIVNWLCRHQEYLTLPDQAALNYVFGGEFAQIDGKWNVCTYKTIVEPEQEISILHFNGERKPWNYKEGVFTKLWWDFFLS